MNTKAEKLRKEIAEKQALLAAMEDDSQWPKTIKYYLHGEKETNWDIGEEIGLEEEAIKEKFRGCCYEVDITLLVYKDGTAVTTHFCGEELKNPVKVC